MEPVRTAAVIHLDRLAANVENIKKRLGPGVALTAVLKGDAYGHGIAGVYPTLRRCGVAGYAVAYWEEGAALRAAGAGAEPIHLLAPIMDGELGRCIEYRLAPSIFSVEQAKKLDALAAAAGTIAPVQIKIDTGMRRIGFDADDVAGTVKAVAQIAALPHIHIAGLFTHFSRADELTCPETEKQLARFNAVLDGLRAAGVDMPPVHVSNSPSILLRPEVQMDAVRGGDVLFGLCPVDEDAWPGMGLREVMTWETYVAMVKTVPAGEPVGYGGTYVTKRETRIATVPVGFCDGYSRRLSNRGKVKIRGQLAPIIGRVCMDQFMVDVTDIPGVARGDRVELLNGEDLSILWMADTLDANVDEIVCGVTKRVPRIYAD